MRELFDDILSIEGIRGLVLFSFSGDLLFNNFDHAAGTEVDMRLLSGFIDALGGIREADLIFAKGRLYVRRTEAGYLMIIMGLFVPMAMLRLQCDILLPSLKPAKKKKGFSRFFKR